MAFPAFALDNKILKLDKCRMTITLARPSAKVRWHQIQAMKINSLSQRVINEILLPKHLFVVDFEIGKWLSICKHKKVESIFFFMSLKGSTALLLWCHWISTKLFYPINLRAASARHIRLAGQQKERSARDLWDTVLPTDPPLTFWLPLSH